MDNHLDNDLIKGGDSRNVVDGYKNWTVESIREDLQSKSNPVHIAIENYQHDYNIGTIVRNANAFNVAGVHIIGKRHWNRRGAMSTEKYLELYNHKTVAEFAKWAHSNKLAIVGVDNIEGSTNLAKIKLTNNIVLVFGQEGPGLSPDMQKVCKNIIAIEQFGSTRSVNVGVASGIILYEWVSQNVLGG